MRSLEITQAGVDAVRAYTLEQVAGERNRPYQMGLLRMVDLSFANPVNRVRFPARREGLEAITIDDASKFYKSYYTPSNAVLVLIGDFDSKKARDRIRKYFESIPSPPAPPPPDSSEPDQAAGHREVVVDPNAKVPVLLISWQIPSLLHKDWFTLKALMDLLRGNTDVARLRSSLVTGAAVATTVEGDAGHTAGPNLFWVAVITVPGKDMNQIERLTLAEIDRIAREGLPDEEMQRLRTDGVRSRAMELVNTTDRASVLTELLASGADPETINQWEEVQRRLTSDELRRVTRLYLDPSKRTVVVVQPGAGK